MTQLQFWLLTILTMFFVTIGITCLAVMLGFFKNADERFKRWAIPGFLAGVVSAWFSLFRLAFVASSMIVTLNMPLDAPGLKSSGTYEYLVIQDKQVERHTGSLQVGFVPPGGWQAIIPDVAPNSAVTSAQIETQNNSLHDPVTGVRLTDIPTDGTLKPGETLFDSHLRNVKELASKNPQAYVAVLALFKEDTPQVAELKAAVLIGYKDDTIASFGGQAEAIKVVNDLYNSEFVKANPEYVSWLANKKSLGEPNNLRTNGASVFPYNEDQGPAPKIRPVSGDSLSETANNFLYGMAAANDVMTDGAKMPDGTIRPVHGMDGNGGVADHWYIENQYLPSLLKDLAADPKGPNAVYTAGTIYRLMQQLDQGNKKAYDATWGLEVAMQVALLIPTGGESAVAESLTKVVGALKPTSGMAKALIARVLASSKLTEGPSASALAVEATLPKGATSATEIAFGSGSTAGDAAKGLSAAEEAGSIRNVNAVGGNMNCVNCVIATDAMLSGQPASALGGGPFRLAVLENLYGAKFGSATTIDYISGVMKDAGAGSRGIVYGSRGGEVGHVFNVVNQGGVVRFLDGQTGKAATFDGYDAFRLLRTNK